MSVAKVTLSKFNFRSSRTYETKLQTPPTETIHITMTTQAGFNNGDGSLCGFVRLINIPEKYHLFIKRARFGSGVPAPEGIRDAFWEFDIDRWLRSIGVEPVFSLPADEYHRLTPPPFQRPALECSPTALKGFVSDHDTTARWSG